MYSVHLFILLNNKIYCNVFVYLCIVMVIAAWHHLCFLSLMMALCFAVCAYIHVRLYVFILLLLKIKQDVHVKMKLVFDEGFVSNI